MLRTRQLAFRLDGLRPPPAEAAATRLATLVDIIDDLDLDNFPRDRGYRRRSSDALSRFSDEEFDRVERLYARRVTIN